MALSALPDPVTVTETVESYLADHPGLLSWERVEDGFWYLRVAGTARRVIPIEIQEGPRTVRVLSYFMIQPEDNAAEAYWYLLKHNWPASGVAFAVAPDGALSLVTRVPLEHFDVDELDAVIGKIVDTTEKAFQSYLRIGFPAYFTGQHRAAD